MSVSHDIGREGANTKNKKKRKPNTQPASCPRSRATPCVLPGAPSPGRIVGSVLSTSLPPTTVRSMSAPRVPRRGSASRTGCASRCGSAQREPTRSGLCGEVGPTVNSAQAHLGCAERRTRPLALTAAAIRAALALAPARAAAAGGPPVIESVRSGYGAEVSVKAKIDPEGLETTYEIGLECSPCGPGDQVAKGTLPAVHESREVTLALTGLKPGQRNWFAVRAANADGETSRRGETLEIPPTHSPPLDSPPPRPTAASARSTGRPTTQGRRASSAKAPGTASDSPLELGVAVWVGARQVSHRS